ncbi:MAG TPA: HisA/HisF-related TIM barrel protein [Acidimicrobiales bacterium]|jgi:phosphoribosylformimino-5-aminoimidazole carboxamide ribotide isomerase
MDLYPAIDLRGGRCVRLVEGDFDRETVYGDDPLLVARGFVDAGAQWIHVVDLDAARRRGDNRAVIAGLAAALPIPIEVGGGVRDGSLLDGGVARVVVGSLAVEDPDAVRSLAGAYPGRVAVGVDHRHGQVRVRGWEEGAGASVAEVLDRLAGAPLAAAVITEIGRDGTLLGPDRQGLAEVLATTALPLIASGGVSTLEDLMALAAISEGGRRLAGVIVGKAFYERRFGVAEALGALAGVGGGGGRVELGGAGLRGAGLRGAGIRADGGVGGPVGEAGGRLGEAGG